MEPETLPLLVLPWLFCCPGLAVFVAAAPALGSAWGLIFSAISHLHNASTFCPVSGSALSHSLRLFSHVLVFYVGVLVWGGRCICFLAGLKFLTAFGCCNAKFWALGPQFLVTLLILQLMPHCRCHCSWKPRTLSALCIISLACSICYKRS